MFLHHTKTLSCILYIINPVKHDLKSRTVHVYQARRRHLAGTNCKRFNV